ncbi:MAG TPA: diphthamide biosynthesis enzyme Dph2 [Thermoplasmata archaeon]|jgi:2-(3-amino-3-carboxypropyl)histidine synthase|nr:diphthamide biosynthesis enzyme Dph2 [Thermoplasmata archaeon]
MGDTERLVEVIRGRAARTVGLQFPVGLRTKAVELAREIESKAGVTCLVSADPSFGACDVAEMPVDLIVHLGHAPMPHLRYNRVFFYDLPGPALASMAFVDAAEPLLPKRVGLLTTTQFRHWLPAIKEHLEKKGHAIRIGEPDRRVAYAGQLLGCDYHTATIVEKDVDGYLYIGTGDFHPLGVAILVDKPVIVADPERGTARDLKEVRDHVLRQRHAAIARAHDAAVFGIIVSKKIGQERMDLALGLKALAEKHDRRANIFLMDLVSPEFLEGYRVDAWVNTACPRIAIEDILQYKQPMLTPQEFEIVLGERDWSEYAFDEIRA